ncbi:MAG: cupin domain-containing protein, partial [Candidatus Saccharibacteria bacterium]
MFISHVDKLEPKSINIPGAAGVTKISPVGPAEGWEGWVMRQFSIAAGGNTPRHSHPWPHINYVLSGKGQLFAGGQVHEISAGSVAYVDSDSEHQFINND